MRASLVTSFPEDLNFEEIILFDDSIIATALNEGVIYVHIPATNQVYKLISPGMGHPQFRDALRLLKLPELQNVLNKGY
jgi:hypothetical protein